MDIHEIVKKLIGPIDPVGCSRTDEKRLENLKATIDLCELLIDDILDVSNSNQSRHEASMKECGIEAAKCLRRIKSNLTDI